MRSVTLATILLIAATAPLSGRAQEVDQETIVVTGHGRVTAPPDVGVIKLTVESTETSSDSAASVVASFVQAILDAIGALDVAGIEVATESYTVQPGRRDQRTQEPIEFKATSNFSVRVSGVTDVGGVIDASLRAGAVQIRGISFEVSDSEDLRIRALASAIDDAKQQARMIADAMGVDLLFHSATTQQPQYGAGSLRLERVYLTALQRGAATNIQPREATSTVTVTMRFGVVQP